MFREEIEKEKQKKHFEQLRAEGKTDQARADLARLAIIRQEREAAAKKREVEQKGLETILIFLPFGNWRKICSHSQGCSKGREARFYS